MFPGESRPSLEKTLIRAISIHIKGSTFVLIIYLSPPLWRILSVTTMGCSIIQAVVNAGGPTTTSATYTDTPATQRSRILKVHEDTDCFERWVEELLNLLVTGSLASGYSDPQVLSGPYGAYQGNVEQYYGGHQAAVQHYDQEQRKSIYLFYGRNGLA